MVVHTDRSVAAAGELLFFKAWLTTGPLRQRQSASGVLRIELLDPEGNLLSSQVYPVEAGMSQGAVRLPDKLAPADYTLRAYTRWMQNYGPGNYYNQALRIQEGPGTGMGTHAGAQPQFFPEGGQLLLGITNKMVIRMKDGTGCGVIPSGRITNGSGSLSVPVQSYGDGYGMALLKPLNTEDYTFTLDDGRSYGLPPVAPSGYSLQINSLERERVRIRIQATPDQAGHSMVLRASMKDRIILDRDIKIGEDLEVNMDIDTEAVAPGILKLELLDATGSVWASRPVRIQDKRNLNISLEPISPVFTEGAEAAFRLRVTDQEGQPVQTEVSLSVADATLAGHAECPDADPSGLPFNALSRQDLFLQDLQALTDPRTGDYPRDIKYPVQRGLELIGYAYDLNNKLLVNTPIQVVASNDSTLILNEVETDASGMLKLDNLNFYGEVPLVFRTRGDDTRSNLVRIEPLHEEIRSSADSDRDPGKKRSGIQSVETTPWTDIDTSGLIALNEAVIQARKLETKESPSVYNVTPYRSVKQDPEKPVPTEILMSRMPGVFVSGQIGGGAELAPRIFIPRVATAAGPILWVVDGFILGNLDGQDHPFNLVPYSDIDRIELIIGADASIFGSRGAGGVFALYTRSGSGLDYIPRKDASLAFRGFEPRVAFSPEKTGVGKGRRQSATPKSLYWDPSIQTDANGEAIVRFTSPADYARVRVTAMGVARDGSSGSVTVTY